MSSLLGHLAMRFTRHPENIATNALHFIIEKSQVARAAVIEHVASTGVALEKNLAFSTQERGEGGEIPDIVAKDEQRRLVLIIESKFWAVLTAQQPVAYLDSLSPDQHRHAA